MKISLEINTKNISNFVFKFITMKKKVEKLMYELPISKEDLKKINSEKNLASKSGRKLEFSFMFLA